jgi:stringent starvation protein B
MNMLSNRPYLLRAFYQWIVDSGCTPMLVINALHPQCKVPKHYARDNEVAFNISPSAVRNLQIMNETIEFKASFSGIIHIISVPVSAVLAIYAEENNEGIFLDGEEDEVGGDGAQAFYKPTNSTMDPSLESVTPPPPAANRPVLKLVE